MKRKGRTRRSEDLTAQTALRLPPEMLDRLRKSAGNHGLGEEIRRRLEASFKAEAGDAKTRELTAAISKLAEYLDQDGEWHGDRFAFEVFKAGVNELLAKWQPQGEPNFTPRAGSTLALFFDPNFEPDAAGKMLARMFLTGWMTPPE